MTSPFGSLTSPFGQPSRSRTTDKTAFRQRKAQSGEVDYVAGLGGYPLNFDAGEHFMRLRTGIDYFPFPPRIGAMSSFMPQLDVLVWHGMYRRKPTGPNFTMQPGPHGMPTPLTNLSWQLSVPGLLKQA